MILKRGKKVRVRADLVVGEYYESGMDSRRFTEEMSEYAGQVVTVGNHAGQIFIIRENNGEFVLNTAMATEPYETESEAFTSYVKQEITESDYKTFTKTLQSAL